MIPTQNARFVLVAGEQYPVFYLGKCYMERKRKKPGVTRIIQRAKHYKSRTIAIRSSNALLESTGYLFHVEEESVFIL